MPTNASVQITYDPAVEPALTVNPSSALVSGQGTVTWHCTAPAGWKAIVTFANDQAPFPPAGEQPEGVYQVSSSVTTEPATVGTNGPWPYSVRMEPSSTARGADNPEVNAVVVVQNNP